jgi:hypothetical protein
MKKLLTLLMLCILAFSQTETLSGQTPGKGNPPPSELTNDQQIQKATARYSISPSPDGITFLQISFEYSWKENGKLQKQTCSLDGYILYLFQTTPLARYVWTGSDHLIFGVIDSPPAPEFAVWILFNPQRPTGNIRTGNLRIR